MKFDPIQYLNLYIDPAVREIVSLKILDSLSKYIIIRTLEFLPDSLVADIQDPKELFIQAQSLVPDYPQKVKGFVQDFKEAYKKETGVD